MSLRNDGVAVVGRDMSCPYGRTGDWQPHRTLRNSPQPKLTYGQNRRLEKYPEPAAHGLPDEGQLAAERAEAACGVGRNETVSPHPAGARRGSVLRAA